MDILQGPLEKEELKEQVLGKLIVSVHQRLNGRRYLIILDDVWDEKMWDGVRNAFPDDNNYSRVVLTMRLSKVATYVSSSSHVHQMQLLNEEQSWDLLRETVYGREAGCPGEFEDIGRTVSRSCKGLPLALVVIGGLLKFNKAKDYWEEVATSATTEVAANDEHLLGIMSFSYKNLPPQLKACFLYFGMFPEDHEIPTKQLVRLWTAEGFLKPRASKTMEEVAEECLAELVERNLVMVKMKMYNGKTKTSSIHDVLRDLSLRQAQKEKLLYRHESVEMEEGTFLRIMNDQRRVSFPLCYYCDTLYGSLVRTFRTPEMPANIIQHFKLLRLLEKVLSSDLTISFRLTNLRYLHVEIMGFHAESIMVPESISKLRNLETFVLSKVPSDTECQLVMPVQIWEMPGLRHLDSQVNVLFPPFPASDLYVSCIESSSLQTLCGVVNFDFTPSVVERIHNLKTLKIEFRSNKASQFSLSALADLNHLEEFSIHRDLDGPHVTDIAFPDKLKKLTLHGTQIPVENMSSVIGRLPNLEVLKLKEDSVRGEVWEPVDGEFLQLKHLKMDLLLLEEWIVESTHFPCLEKLVITFFSRLNEVPASIGDIETLQELFVGEKFWVYREKIPRLKESVRKIQEEQERCGNSLLRVTYQNMQKPGQ